MLYHFFHYLSITTLFFSIFSYESIIISIFLQSNLLLLLLFPILIYSPLIETLLNEIAINVLISIIGKFSIISVTTILFINLSLKLFTTSSLSSIFESPSIACIFFSSYAIDKGAILFPKLFII